MWWGTLGNTHKHTPICIEGGCCEQVMMTGFAATTDAAVAAASDDKHFLNAAHFVHGLLYPPLGDANDARYVHKKIVFI